MRSYAVLCALVQLAFELSSCTRLQVVPGSTVDLPCRMFQSDNAEAVITWKFNGKDISESSPGSFRTKKNGFYLSILTVTAANEGEYVCLWKENNVELMNTYDIVVDASVSYAIKVIEGSSVHLPCHFPLSTQVNSNALWFRETYAGTSTVLTLGNQSSDGNNRLKLLYPDDHDQTILLRDTVMDDAGIYQCRSEAGVKLSTIHVIVEAAPTPAPHMCKGFTTAWEPCEDTSSHLGEHMLKESMTEFSMKIYSFLRESNPSSNLLFSPISINGMLSHLLLGARGDTRKAIEAAIYVPQKFYCVHFQMKKLREKLVTSLQMASQIYYKSEMDLSDSFTNQSIQFYEAEPTRLLNNSEENTQMINSWVANKTRNQITHLVDFISPATQLILLNAVSFSGQWKVKFDVNPKQELFTTLNGDMVFVPILTHDDYPLEMMYDPALETQVGRFALSGDSSLYILLPPSNTIIDLQRVEEKMTDSSVRQMIEKMKKTRPQYLEVILPQIKLEVQPDMNVLLKNLGLSSLFEGANLCGLSPEGMLVLDDARHKAFLTLTEQGVEAAAATSLSFSRTRNSFSAMRPFILLLWSDQANVPLFVGRVTNP
ncbi:plasma protease C1 inhibitor [Solea senegalensis]|nr:plasma protease C1 inhibitor [Solea senegalensis]KAG7486932.1 plasma protease C1 inhibitor [Solea senegalensis]